MLTWVNAARATLTDHNLMKHPNSSNRRRGLWAAASLLAAVLSLSPARADDFGDPIAGRQVAEAWCANCHAFPGSTHATVTGAPSFPAVAENKAMTRLALRAFLQTTHDRMPDLHLSNNEMDDLIAFILSSRGR
jgi:mono/diheme cytochrome c family protein